MDIHYRRLDEIIPYENNAKTHDQTQINNVAESIRQYGFDFEVRRGDCVQVSKLDAQAEHGKTIFGSGLLLSDAKAAERVAAERAAARVWRLSARELKIVKSLG